ncbi:Efflux pump radE [Lachnellula arida]|uniref:Efflux pump radE n=1 Tax=Lachnellula arida TaxID=1316785 RepID=A0A8T9B6G8_9HELO|nr:Efflux pump radE [Lachnellula arida]
MGNSQDYESSNSVYSGVINQRDDVASRQDIESQAGHENSDTDTTVQEKAAKDPNIVDWDGPDDPAKPMNWSSAKKIGAIAMVSLITMLSPLASTIIAPSTPQVMKAFNSTNETLGSFITSVYLLGYCFGPLVIAPVSEIYGRSITYNVCNTIFLIFSIACAVADSEGSLIVFRLFCGIAASCPLTLGAGTIADMVPLERRGMAMAFWIMGPLLGPAVGPLVGAFLGGAKGWRWIFWLITIIAGVVWACALFLLRESYPFVILKWKTQRLRKETGNQNLRSALDTGKSPKDLFQVSIIRPLKMLFLSPVVFLVSLLMAIVYGDTYLLFTTFDRVFQGQYGFSNGVVGLVYLGSGIGSMLGLLFCGGISDRLVKRLTKRNGGSAKPEYRLPAMFAGAVIVPLGLFMYGWTADKKVHWIVPIIGVGVIGFGLFAIFMPATAYLVDIYPVYAASVTAAATVFRSLLGALLPLAGNSMYDALGLGWGTSTLAFISVAFIPLPLIFWRYGQRIRDSKYGQVSF